MMNCRKAFTLVEMTVVLAILSIVVTMAVIFINSYQKNTQSIANNTKAISDINMLKDTVNRWLNEYDSKRFNLTDIDVKTGYIAEGTTLIQISASTDGSILSAGSDTLEYHSDTKRLIWKKSGVTTESHEFEILDECSFSIRKTKTDTESETTVPINNYMVNCEVSFTDNDTEKELKLIFNIFSNSERSRYNTAS